MMTFSLIYLLACNLSAAQAIDPYFPLSGSRATQEQREKNQTAVRQLKFDPEIWPEVTFEKRQQALLPLMKKTTYWSVQLPVFDHTEKVMKPFGFKFFPSPNYSPEKSRLVVIYPTIEGESIVEGNLTRMALNEGHHVLIAPVFEFDYKSGTEGLEDIRERTLFGIKAVKTFFDFLEYCFRNSNFPDQIANQVLKNVRPQNILQIGVSNGTVASFMVSQTDHRVSDQILIVPIGNVSGVFALSTNEKLTAFRDEQMRFYGLTDVADFAKLAKEKIKYDPLDYVDSFNNPRTLAFFQQDDLTVPGQFQRELLDRMKAMVVSQELDITRSKDNYARRMEDYLLQKGIFEADHRSSHNRQSDFEAYQNQRILQAIDRHQKGNDLFYDLGFGHIRKILSIVFVFSDVIKKFFTLQAQFNSKWYPEDANFMLRETPLVGADKRSCKAVIGHRN